MTAPQYALVQPAARQSDLGVIVQYLLPLMLRNVASDGFVFTDPADASDFSAPGCIIASPSFELDLSVVRQNYVYNWTRDAAVAAMEIAAAHLPAAPGAGSGPLGDYVRFAATCQRNAERLGRACYTIEGRPRPWTDQDDGPALQTIAVLDAFPQLDAGAQATGRGVVQRNVDYLVANYQEPSYNLWEETSGQSLFTRAVQLRCLTTIRSNTLGFAVPDGIDAVIDWLGQAVQAHRTGSGYTSILDPTDPRDGYDPNIDVVMACIYGALECTDPQLLATAGDLRRQWSDPTSALVYPINVVDAAQGMGPLLGRYPGDVYDGDNDDSGRDHPWALCTANFAQLYHLLATAVTRSKQVPFTEVTSQFFAQVGVDATTTPTDCVQRLRGAGDAMLQSIVHHSDHLELSEQFDANSGYEKSVRNLTWSYAAFLSAVRARVPSTP